MKRATLFGFLLLCALLALGGCSPAAPELPDSSLVPESSVDAEESAPTQPLDEAGFIQSVMDSHTLTDGTVEITLPDSFPGENRLEIEAYAHIYDLAEGSTRVVEATEFLARNDGGGWTAGETYRAPLLEGEIPDDATVSLAVRFLAPATDGFVVSSWKLCRWSYQNGQPKILSDPLSTVATPETRDGETVIRYTEENGDGFAVALRLPQSWTLRASSFPLGAVGFAPLELYDGDALIGTMSYNEFLFFEATTPENYHRMVYSGLMIGSVVSWDNDYTPVTQTDAFGAATCRISVRNEGEPGKGAEAGYSYHYGVLAHDVALQRYIALELTGADVTAQQAHDIAVSIRFLHD